MIACLAVVKLGWWTHALKIHIIHMIIGARVVIAHHQKLRKSEIKTYSLCIYVEHYVAKDKSETLSCRKLGSPFYVHLRGDTRRQSFVRCGCFFSPKPLWVSPSPVGI